MIEQGQVVLVHTREGQRFGKVKEVTTSSVTVLYLTGRVQTVPREDVTQGKQDFTKDHKREIRRY